MVFQYRAKNKKGENFVGMVEASSLEEANGFLNDRDLVIIFLKEKKILKFGQLKIFGRVKNRDLVIFFRQLAVMISSAFPIVKALRTVGKQIDNANLKTIVSETADEVEGGGKFSEALAKYPKVFSDFLVNMIKIGESSGKLDEILNYLADQQEKDYDLMSKIKGAMTYPLVVLTTAIGMGVFMMVFMIPRLADILEETGAALPLPTRMLMAISNFFIHYWIVLLFLVIGLTIFFKIYTNTPMGRKQWDYVKLGTPVFGTFFQKIYLVRFTRSLSTLILGGIHLTVGLKIVSEVIGNTVYKELIEKTIKEVEDGNPISSIFLQSKVIPPMLSHMLDAGEQTGKLDDILAKLSNFYSREIDNLVNNIMTIIEPIILVLLGIGVGVMVAAFILPMYNLAGSF